MAIVNKFNVNNKQVTLDADIIENMSANNVSYEDSFKYDDNTVGDKLSELDLKVGEIDKVINGTSDTLDITDFVKSNLVDLKSIFTTNGSELSNSVGCSGTVAYIDLQGAIYLVIEMWHGDDTWRGLAFYDADKNFIKSENAIKGQTHHEIQVPENAKYFRTTWFDSTASNYGELKCVLHGEFDGVGLRDEILECKEKIKEMDAEISGITTLHDIVLEMEAEKQKNDVYSAVMIDMMQKINNSGVPSKKTPMNVVSATTQTITLSSSDAATIGGEMQLVVKMGDGTHKFVHFKAPNGNTITRASHDTTDLSNASSVESVHDNAIHLSCYAYRAMAECIVSEMNRQAMIDGNVVAGYVFNKLARTEGWQKQYADIYDENGNLVCKPNFSSKWVWGGATYTSGIIANNDNDKPNGWVTKCYKFIQKGNDNFVEFELSLGRKRQGFAEVQVALDKNTYTSGSAKYQLYADGKLISEENLAETQKLYVADNLNCESIKVRIIVTSEEFTEVKLYSIRFVNLFDVKLPIIKSHDSIAFIGDSWSQWPAANAPSYVASDTDNTEVYRPDGTKCDGFGYMPKQLSHITGASVDNWGKGGKTTEDWGLDALSKALAYKKYDYVVIEFFTNDNNLISRDLWLENLIKMKNKCKANGARPIFIMPCRVMAPGQSLSHGIMHEMLMNGLVD